MKTCNACKIKKPFDQFHKNKTKLDGLELKCKLCRNNRVMELYYHNKENPKIQLQEGLKRCTTCNTVKSVDQFNKRSSSRDGFRHHCKPCHNNQNSQYDQLKKDKIRKRKQEYYIKNKDSIIKRTSSYNLHKYKTDLMYRLKNHIRGRVKSILKKKRLNKNNTFLKYLGCSLPEFKAYLEARFTEGMTWKNYGHGGWVIDHIIPISKASNEEELYKLNHHTNLQPLWEIDNMIKSDK